jgi:hypothetical protein
MIGIAALVAGTALSHHGTASGADAPVAVCRSGVTDDTLMPLPPNLVPRARDLFHLAMPDALVRRTTVYRCMNGRVLLCTAGANLVCGKANTRRDLPGVATWCRDHRNADVVPMSVTGHDTIHGWRCSDGAPAIVGPPAALDARGFLAGNWKDAGGQPD